MSIFFNIIHFNLCKTQHDGNTMVGMRLLSINDYRQSISIFIFFDWKMLEVKKLIRPNSRESQKAVCAKLF